MRTYLLSAVVASIPFAAGIALLNPRLVEAKKATFAQFARGKLLTLHSAQSLYRERSLATVGVESPFDPRHFTYARSLEELGQTCLINGDVTSGEAHHYVFELTASSSQPNQRWVAVANPLRYAGPWSFAIDQRGELYAAYRQTLEPHGDARMPPVARPWAQLRDSFR